MPRSRVTLTTPCLPMASPSDRRGAEANAGSQVTAAGRLTNPRTRPDERASTVSPASGPLPSTCKVTCSSSLVRVASSRPARAPRPRASAGMAVMIDPHTGEILAMASVPTYNPNDPSDAAKRGARNRTISDTFEPGSTLKTLSFAAALDAGKVKPEDRIDCQMGQLAIGKFHIRDDHPKGVLSAAEVFKFSSNIGTVKIARRIGKEALWNALDRFGFGRPTYLGLPGERRGILRPISRWGEIEFATHAFGQGLTVSPVQLAAGFAAIAAYGVYHPPKLALQYIGSDGKPEPIARPPEARGETRVMSESAARTLLGIMQGVTEDGTAKAAAIPGYPVAGKTGTAQKVTNGRYDPSKFLSSFVGIVPADNPRLVVAVMIDEPQGIHYGGVVAAPAFKAIAEGALRYLGVAPSSPAIAQDKQTKKPAKP